MIFNATDSIRASGSSAPRRQAPEPQVTGSAGYMQSMASGRVVKAKVHRDAGAKRRKRK